MTVHHATAKRAADQGFLIADSTENEDAFRLTATLGKVEVALEGDDAKALVNAIPAIRMLVIEHGFTLSQPEDFSVTIAYGEHEVMTEVEIDDLNDDTVTEAAQALTEAIEAGEVEAIEAEEEEEQGASVVPDTYKKRYAEAGHPNHCGDWLANVLNGHCLTDGGFEIAPMLAICEANGVEAEQYLRRKTPGWQGRFRMTSRNKLTTAIVKANGILHIPAEANGDGGDIELQAPAEWLAGKTPKPKGKAAVAA